MSWLFPNHSCFHPLADPLTSPKPSLFSSPDFSQTIPVFIPGCSQLSSPAPVLCVPISSCTDTSPRPLLLCSHLSPSVPSPTSLCETKLLPPPPFPALSLVPIPAFVGQGQRVTLRHLGLLGPKSGSGSRPFHPSLELSSPWAPFGKPHTNTKCSLK